MLGTPLGLGSVQFFAVADPGEENPAITSSSCMFHIEFSPTSGAPFSLPETRTPKLIERYCSEQIDCGIERPKMR